MRRDGHRLIQRQGKDAWLCIPLRADALQSLCEPPQGSAGQRYATTCRLGAPPFDHEGVALKMVSDIEVRGEDVDVGYMRECERSPLHLRWGGELRWDVEGDEEEAGGLAPSRSYDIRWSSRVKSGGSQGQGPPGTSRWRRVRQDTGQVGEGVRGGSLLEEGRALKCEGGD